MTPYSDHPLSDADLAIVARTGGDVEQPIPAPRAIAASTFRMERRYFILETAEHLHDTWDRDPEDLLWERHERGVL